MRKGGKSKWIIIVVIVIAIFGIAMGGGDENDNSSDISKNPEKKIEYTKVSVDDMAKALEENAATAADKYKDKYLEITGKLDDIDSAGDYITIASNDEWAIYTVQCFIKDDEQLKTIKSMKSGNKITVRGKCIDVGEVLGYSLDIESIIQ